MDPLEVDPEKLAASSDAFTTIADTARRIASTLSGGVQAAGNYAGTGSFADAYNRLVGPGITGLVDSLHGLGDGMAGTAAKLLDSAGLYKTSDQVNTESVPGQPISPPPDPHQVRPLRG
jgi:hypothetical protein